MTLFSLFPLPFPPQSCHYKTNIPALTVIGLFPFPPFIMKPFCPQSTCNSGEAFTEMNQLLMMSCASLILLKWGQISNEDNFFSFQFSLIIYYLLLSFWHLKWKKVDFLFIINNSWHPFVCFNNLKCCAYANGSEPFLWKDTHQWQHNNWGSCLCYTPRSRGLSRAIYS